MPVRLQKLYRYAFYAPMELIELIRSIEADKRSKKIEPTHATLHEVLRLDCEAARLIPQYEQEGQIITGRTINSRYIKII